MACYLIAGAAGYVGSHLAKRLLAQGHKVRGLIYDPDQDVDLIEELAALGMVVWTGDLTRPETLIGVADGMDYVYNLSSSSILENDRLKRTFIDGNQNLIAACSRSASVRSYVFTSNTAPYGDAGDTLLDEDAPVALCYPLGEIMVAAEQTIMDLVRRHNFPAIILRVGMIYGPGHDFVDCVLEDTMPIIGNGRNFVSRIHISDLLAVLEQVGIAGQPGSLYNVADDEPIRIFDLYADICDRMGLLPPSTLSQERALQSGINPNVVGLAASSVRLNNARLKHDLALELAYPTCWAWLDERLGVAQEMELVA